MCTYYSRCIKNLHNEVISFGSWLENLTKVSSSVYAIFCISVIKLIHCFVKSTPKFNLAKALSPYASLILIGMSRIDITKVQVRTLRTYVLQKFTIYCQKSRADFWLAMSDTNSLYCKI